MYSFGGLRKDSRIYKQSLSLQGFVGGGDLQDWRGRGTKKLRYKLNIDKSFFTYLSRRVQLTLREMLFQMVVTSSRLTIWTTRFEVHMVSQHMSIQRSTPHPSPTSWPLTLLRYLVPRQAMLLREVPSPQDYVARQDVGAVVRGIRAFNRRFPRW